ncbi:RNA export mediator Gle1 [Coccidioides immitis RS]|uniref:mRNA export factor GLE1 n=4 Tax=Coccidioides TaxID=5500 RepID=J3K9D3_COCIM|nr:RNA export mediator Gle1 [Coccidioides immitis RS]XP_003070155.1 RNA export mediator gle1, putative [Coccidioides posadasii C735 delta SOWgp]EFW16541.1 RNA export mediator Gle1 [Coccidioides posadasii str. Silveira]KMP04136.1 hypothetical protein CIRG_03827 [Coccidioides immitis RMSCC 2394]TPX24271.1 hypothetical protein DIZ76_013617 [Coccidioides immitis]EAS31498.3 RNA export mediator Gle1 [Coccidioides immitis RS]EER28010.1 RNA export mediator gle1, putative [Coccidioides posadasii C735 |eukprot:XP_003070155.1 RNA export mediator gle1, putative [Coccidioides posadasii C735 delta SOWgp]
MARTKGLLDSPSKQLMQDLIRDLEQVRLHNSELKRVKQYERRSFYERLDQIDREREEVHNAALSAAAAKRDQLRREAEETLHQHLRAAEEERRRKEEEERRRKEKIEREKAEKERREREEAARREAERKAREEQRRRQAEETERIRKAKEEAEKKAREEREERERLEQEKKKQEEERLKVQKEQEKKVAEQKRPEIREFLGETRRTPQEVTEHKRYLELHKHLKQFRKYMVDETKKNPVLKQHMGDMRRTIKKCVGQLLTNDTAANRTPTNEIVTILKKASALQEPSIDIRQFIAFPPPHVVNEESKVPALLIYLLNIFAKAIIAQLVAEAGVTPKCAGPLGVLTAQVFSMDAFVYKGCSMIDILLAKYHVVCPVLWGFYGSESTQTGKTALGWWRDEPDGPFVSRQVHEERMIGLGAGFAAISLRDFSKTSRQNPLPNTHFWKALSIIVNVPPEEIQDTHLTVLGAMLKFSAQRVVGFWGDLGLLALRHAIVTFPSSLSKKSSARSSVEILRDLYAREHCILI